MDNELIETYLKFKRKILLEYAMTFYKVYDFKTDKVLKDEVDYKRVFSGIIDVYLSKYYLRTKSELNRLNKDKLSEEEFGITLSLAMVRDYYGEEYASLKKNNETFLYNVAIIIYVITKIDKKITFYKESSVTVKNIATEIQKMFKNIFENFDISKNPFLVDILSNKIKDAERMEQRYFELIKGTDFYNEFATYESGVYYVSFNYFLTRLDSFKRLDVTTIYNRYKFKEKYLPISYEGAAITILKCFANDINVPRFILPVTAKYLAKEENIDYLRRVFSNPYIKDRVSFSLYYEDYKKNYKRVAPLRDMNFDIVLFLDDDEVILDYSYIKFDYKLYVTKKFVDNNPRFNNFVQTGKVDYKVVEFKEKYITEDELINSNI